MNNPLYNRWVYQLDYPWFWGTYIPRSTMFDALEVASNRRQLQSQSSTPSNHPLGRSSSPNFLQVYSNRHAECILPGSLLVKPLQGRFVIVRQTSEVTLGIHKPLGYLMKGGAGPGKVYSYRISDRSPSVGGCGVAYARKWRLVIKSVELMTVPCTAIQAVNYVIINNKVSSRW